MEMKIVEPDFERLSRCGIPEVVFGQSKTAGQMVGIAEEFISKSGRFIATKTGKDKADAVLARFPELDHIYSELAGVLVVKEKGFKVEAAGSVGVVTAGTSDIPIAEEARIVLEELGCRHTQEISCVGEDARRRRTHSHSRHGGCAPFCSVWSC